jgi:hypothetical protein
MRDRTPSPEVRQLLTEAINAPPSTVSLADVLGGRADTSRFAASHHSITVPEVRALVGALAREGTIPAASAQELTAALDAVEGAPDAAARGQSIVALNAVTRRIPGRAGTLLRSAARGLTPR